jgi:hypothetical protein
VTADPKRGRPPVDADDRTVLVKVRLPPRQYDELYAQARRDDVTIPELIRRTLRQKASVR